MSESCMACLNNNSGRSLDQVYMWHTPGEPDAEPWMPGDAFLNKANLPNNGSMGVRVPLSSSATDYWRMAVLFQGDGTWYVIAGTMAAPWKEYEVSDGSTITFTINTYTSGMTDQNDITIAYSGDDGGSARLLNPVTSAIFGSVGEAATHMLAELAVG